MVWLGMVLAVTLAQSLQGWSEWGFRITVLSSLVANLVVGFLSRTRRRSAPRWWWALLGKVAKLVLWLAYQAAEAISTSAIGSLSLSGSDASSEEKQVAAFWGSFLVLHLGGPDNLTAYALEDNKISNRKWLEIIFRILGVSYAIYRNTHRGDRSWALLPVASVVMLVAGGVRYLERAMALRKANFDSMQEDADDDVKKKKKKKMDLLKCRIKRAKRQGRSLSDGEALLLAQDLFPVWRHALVDSSVDPTSPMQQASEMILRVSKSDEPKWDWESMCKVAEMELSLIYEFLYTKAILARTWHYYLIRLLSPLFTAAAAFLFCVWLQQQQGDDGHGVRGSFVRITYALLAITFLMDVAWLLRALGSTWAYAFFQLQAAGTRRRWWCRIHRIIVCLDPLQLFGRDPVSHRRWSGTIGRYNLLDECTPTTTFHPEWWPVSVRGDDKPRELGYLSKLPPCVKEVLFKRVTKILQQAINNTEEEGGGQEELYSRLDIRKHWGRKAFSRAPENVINKLKEAKVDPFGEEFEEDVLLWHITTCMVLVLPDIRGRQRGRRRILACAIEVMSEYMMFLVAVRRQMLPGLVLHSQLQVTRKKLVELLKLGERSKFVLSNHEKLNMNNKEKLAKILRHVRVVEPEETKLELSDQILGNEGTQLLVHAVDIYFHLSGDERPPRESRTADPWSPPPLRKGMLEIIFNVWEAHAEQLSAGGDLTTVLWMLIQHAGPFCIRAAKNITLEPPEEKKEEPVPPPPSWPPPKEKPKKEEPARAPSPPSWPPPSPLPAPPPPCCPVCPPYYHPSYPPVCPPYYDPSWPRPWYPQFPPQHERPGDEPEEAREDEHEDSSSSDEDSESEE